MTKSKNLIIVIAILVISGCKPYQYAKNGFTVKGYDHFVSINHKLTVYIGLDSSNWEDSVSAIKTTDLSSEERRILRRLGYKSNNYQILFKKDVRGTNGYALLSLTNSQESIYEKDALIDIRNLQPKKTDKGEWYYETIPSNNSQIYHAIVPVYQTPEKEKYLKKAKQ